LENYQIEEQDLHPKPLRNPVKIVLNIVLFGLFLTWLAPRVLFSWAGTYYEKGEYKTALIFYNVMTWIHPKNPYAYYDRGLTYVSLNQNEFALADFSKAIDIDPAFDHAYVGRCNIYNQQEKFDLAIADCTKAIELGTSEIMAYVNRGLAYFYQEKYDLVASDLTKVIDMNPGDALPYQVRGMPHFYRGASYAALGKNDLALADLKIAAESNPDKAKVYLWLGNVYANLQQYSEAITAYQKSITISKDAYTYCVLGVTYTKMGDFSSSITSFEEGLKLTSNDELSWCKTALENAKQGIPTP
jgi:tetratricopeptide (TPR) repeat protein